jgi:hypothetical protein
LTWAGFGESISSFLLKIFSSNLIQESGMLKRAAELVLLCVSIAGWSGCGSTSSHYVFATSSNQVLAFREDPNSGVLTAISGSPFTAGNGARSAVLAPSKKFLYVANSGDNNIS